MFILSCALGLGILLWSAADWFQWIFSQREAGSFCSISSYWNCDRASFSPWGSWWNLPIGLWGAAWFWTILFLGLGAGAKRHLLRGLLAFGVLLSVAFAFVLFFVIKVGCLICITSYVAVFLAAFSGWNEFPTLMSRRTSWVTIAIGILSLGGYGLMKRQDLLAQIPETEFMAWFQSVAPHNVPQLSPLRKGSELAPIQVIEFSDFGCPHCQRAASVLIPYLSSQSDVQIHFYPFPLDPECQPNMKRGHPYSCEWSKAALCLGKQGKFWDYHDRIFKAASERGSLPVVSDTLQDWGIYTEEMKHCLSDPATADELRKLIQVAHDLQITGTPTIYVNGRKVPGLHIRLYQRILEELRK